MGFLKVLFENKFVDKVYNIFIITLEHRPHGRELPVLPRSESTSEFQPLEDKEVEYFFASDASAIIEHTNRVIYFEVRDLLAFLKIKVYCISSCVG